MKNSIRSHFWLLGVFLFILIVGSPTARADDSDLKERMQNLIPIDQMFPKEVRDEIDQRKAEKLKSGRNLEDSDELEFLEAPDRVDMRSNDTPIQTQVGGTCTAFGLVASLENLMKGKVKLSEQHLWSMYQQYQMDPALAAAKKNYITLQEFWPVGTWQGKPDYKKYADHNLKKFTALGDNVSLAVSALASGKPVYLGAIVTQDWMHCKVHSDPNSPAINGGHAVAIVGYEKNASVAGGGYFIIKNSWGKKCAESGYQYLPFNYCKRAGMYCGLWAIDEAGLRK